MEDDMPKYLTIHNETGIERILLYSRWTEISRDPRAEWQMTLFTTDLGRRYCEWDAPNQQIIEEIFQELEIKWSEIVEVEMTAASRWRLWEMETGKQMKNCWEVTACGREPEDSAAADEAFCPAAVGSRNPGRNRAPFSGTYCWKAVGTFCKEKEQGTLAEDRIDSTLCPFFGQAEQEQTHRFEPLSCRGEILSGKNGGEHGSPSFRPS